MRPLVRLAKDPTTPPSLREALEGAALEGAPPETLKRVLGEAALGAAAAGVVASGLAHASRAAPRWVATSIAAKGVSVVAIFAAGAAAGGYAVHRHDLARIAEATVTATRADPRHREAPVEGEAPHAKDQVEDRVAEPSAAEPEAPQPERTAVRVAERAEPAEVPRRSAAARAADVRHPSPSALRTETTSPAPDSSGLLAPGAAPSESVDPPSPPSARAEFESLRGIRDAVDGNRPGDALAAIEAHRTQFPESAFDQELLLLEAEARWAGRHPAVCSILSTFATRYPRSLLLRRAQGLAVRARCAPAGGTEPSSQ